MDNEKSRLAAELFSQIPAEMQERIIILLQSLLTEQESNPDIPA